jgi:transcriptional regulator with PAS, ATPase and Fis domain
VVAATNRDLEDAMANGTFRSDLFYRLNVFPIHMPPLRERQGDILTLLEYFVQRFSRKLGKTFSKIDKRAVELCRSYDWPGNVRELQNVVERSVIVSSDGCFVSMKLGYLQALRRSGRGNTCLNLRTATRVASGRSSKPYSRKVEAEFTVPTELQPSFEFHRQLLTPRSRNCKSVRATSNSSRAFTA